MFTFLKIIPFTLYTSLKVPMFYWFFSSFISTCPAVLFAKSKRSSGAKPIPRNALSTQVEAGHAALNMHEIVHFSRADSGAI